MVTDYTPAELHDEARRCAKMEASVLGVKLGMRAPNWTIRILSDHGVQLRVRFHDSKRNVHEATMVL